MTVGCFGGTFDPPHLGHLEVARCAQSLYGLDEVWWIPACKPPHKDHADMSSYKHRMNMTRLAIGDNASMSTSDIELRLPQPSYTVATIKALQQQYPAHEFVLVLGQDSFAQFVTWRQPDVIAQHVRLLVYPRDRAPLTNLPSYLAGRIELMKVPPLAIESASIRLMVRENRPITSFVTDPVRAYIDTHGLYRSQSVRSDDPR